MLNLIVNMHEICAAFSWFQSPLLSELKLARCLSERSRQFWFFYAFVIWSD